MENCLQGKIPDLVIAITFRTTPYDGQGPALCAAGFIFQN